MADRFAHTLDLVLAAFVERQLEARGAEEADLGGRGTAVFQLDAFGQLLQRGV